MTARPIECGVASGAPLGAAAIAEALRRAFVSPDNAEAERLRRLAATIRAETLAAFGSVGGPVRDERQGEMPL